MARSPLDDLVDLPDSAAGDQVAIVDPFLEGAPPPETDTEQRRSNVVKAKDLAQRGIPAFTTESGDVTAVRDETGAALSSYDKSHGIAFDSKGEPKAISYGEEGAPILKDPFAGLPSRTDMKTGDQYQVRPGLPWKWVGQDAEVAAKVSVEKRDKEIAKESALMGRKLSLDHADLVSATTDRKELHSGLIGEVPTLQDPKYAGADAPTVHKAIDDHFNSLYAAPEANAKAGYFGTGDLSPDAQALRTDLDAKKAAAHDSADKLFQLNDHITQLGDTVAEGRARSRASVETLLAHQRGEPGPLDQPAPTEGGQLEAGNIDLAHRPVVHNADGSVSTVKSFSIGTDKGEVLIPQVVDGRMLSKEQAIEHFKQTGEHLGAFDSPESANAYAEKLHQQQAIATAEDPVTHVTKAIEGGAIPDPAQAAALAAAHDAADANKKASELAKTNPTLADQFKGLAQGILHGLASGVAEIVKGLPSIEKLSPTGALSALMGQQTPLEAVAPKLGGAIQAKAEEGYDKTLSGTVGSKIGNFAGGALPFVATSLIPGGAAVTVPITVSTLFSAGYASTHDDAIAHGAPPEKAVALGYLSGAVNGVLGLPFRGAGKAIMSVFGDTAPSVVKEALESAFNNGIEIAGKKFVGAEATGIMLDRLKTAIESGALPASAKNEARAGIDAIFAEIKRTPAERAAIIAKEMAKSGGIGAGVQTTQNIIRQQYNPDQGTFEGVPEMALGFAALAGASTGFQQVMRARQAKQALDLLAKQGGGTPPEAGLLTGPQAPPPKSPPGAPAPTEKPVAGREVDTAAHEAATSPLNEKPQPTEAQKKAGNYQKGHITVSGLPISIENPAGSLRDPTYPALASHYGYIKGTVGADKDHVDIFIKQETPLDWKGPVYVVDQNDQKTGEFDEHKAIIGVNSHEEAAQEYMSNYDQAGRGMIGAVTEFKTAADFKSWLTKGEKGQPVSEKYGTQQGGDEVARGNVGENAQTTPAVAGAVSEGTSAAEPPHETGTGAQPVNADATGADTGTSEPPAPTEVATGTSAGETGGITGREPETPATRRQGTEGADQGAKNRTNPTTVLDAENRLWRLTRKTKPHVLPALRKQYGGRADYLDIVNQHANQLHGLLTGAFDAGDHITIGRQRFQVTSSDESGTHLRSTETGQKFPHISRNTAELRAQVNSGNYLLEPQAELEKIPTSEQKGASAERPAETSKVSAIGEGLVAKPQRLSSDTGTKRRVSSPEDARGVVEANVKGNREHLDRAATKVRYQVHSSESGFRTQAETGDVLLDLDKISEHAGKVHDTGGNSEHYISSALQEEFIHSQQIKAAGNQFMSLYTSIWKGLGKEAQTALTAAYPDSSEPATLGAEYERMVIQHLNDDMITEAHHRDITALLPFVTGKQTTEVMNNIQRVLSVAEPGKEAPVEAAAPEPQKAPAPKAEARAPPKSTSEWLAEDKSAFRKQKAQLTKAENAKDWQAVINAANDFEKYYEDRGISVPDDWARWQRAKEDAQLELRRAPQYPSFLKDYWAKSTSKPSVEAGTAFTPERLASAGLTRAEVVDAINAAVKRGVSKELILDRSKYTATKLAFEDITVAKGEAPQTVRDAEAALAEDADFMARQHRRKTLESHVARSYAPSLVRATLRTLLQSGPRKEPSVDELNQAQRKLAPYLEKKSEPKLEFLPPSVTKLHGTMMPPVPEGWHGAKPVTVMVHEVDTEGNLVLRPNEPSQTLLREYQHSSAWLKALRDCLQSQIK